MIKPRLFSTLAVALVLFSGGCCHEELCRSEAASLSGVAAPAAPAANAAETYVKTELYFGLSKPGGGTVSDAEWKSFLDEHVTSAFPDGLTVIDGYGQWKNDNGKIVKENSKVLILIHKPGADANTKLDAIISSYKKLFQQESVLRVTTAATVSF